MTIPWLALLVPLLEHWYIKTEALSFLYDDMDIISINNWTGNTVSLLTFCGGVNSESEMQSELDSVILNQSIIMFDGVPMTGYFLNTIKDFLIVDVQKFLLSNRLVKECEYCKRLFIPSRKSYKYCRLPNIGKITCGELAHKNRNKTDFERLRDKARPEQRSSLINISTTKKYDVDILQQMYDEWSLECAKQYKKYKAKNDLDGFKKWIEKTKYTPSRIKNEYKKRLKTKNNVT